MARTAKFLGITNGESDVNATAADVGGQDVRLVLEALVLNKHCGNFQFFIKMVASNALVEKCFVTLLQQ